VLLALEEEELSSLDKASLEEGFKEKLSSGLSSREGS
jgi:hypothetical protein